MPRHVNFVAHYSPEEVEMASAHFTKVTGLTANKFFEWLGFDKTYGNASYGIPAMSIYINGPARKKMDLLLSPHYRTLFKAWEINNGSVCNE